MVMSDVLKSFIFPLAWQSQCVTIVLQSKLNSTCVLCTFCEVALHIDALLTKNCVARALLLMCIVA